MMAEENKVILHGFWASPYVKGVELALKLKGIPFDYMEEDLKNKSSLLLKYNPVYKKVPVLIHNGKPIVESLVIIQYIDETWKNGPPLLPKDPYKKSQVLFWTTFLHKQLFETTLCVLKTEGEVQEKAIQEVNERLKQLEEGMKGLISEGSRFVNGDDMGILDIVMCTLFGAYKLQEEVLGITLVDSEKHPVIMSWLSGLADNPIVKEATPPREKIMDLLRLVRKMATQSAPAVA